MKYLFIVLLALAMISCNSTTDSGPHDLTAEQMIGQMVMVGFRGFEVAQDSQIARDISRGIVGGVILFDKDAELGTYERNIQSPEQLARLVSGLQSFATTKLFISIDQEGGRVSRLKSKYGFPESVSQQYLGTLNNADTTHFYGARTAEMLSRAGVNLNFAPVVDVNVNPQCPVIGALERSFSSDAAVVGANAEIIIGEHKSKGISCALKHFPGHGSSQSDSHLGVVDVTNTWQQYELDPYRYLFGKKIVDMVMTAHIFNGNIDNVYPTTLSYSTITGMLRNTLGFDGVVITDDMNMKAISENYGFEKAVELSINAGVDIILVANNLQYNKFAADTTFQTIRRLYSDGKISLDRIRQSYTRIMALKAKRLPS